MKVPTWASAQILTALPSVGGAASPASPHKATQPETSSPPAHPPRQCSNVMDLVYFCLCSWEPTDLTIGSSHQSAENCI